jgi:rhomboid protease GluP
MQDHGQAHPPTPSDSAGTPPVFEIRFSRGRASNAFGLYGKGTLSVGARQLTIHARRHRLFRSGLAVAQTIELADIFDVTATGATVDFDVWGGTRTTPLRVRFATASEAAADAVIHALPGRQTHDFAREQADHNVFFDQIDALRARVWATPMIIGVNLLVFLLMLRGGAGLFSVDPRVAVLWGSNFGPLTLHGQWWRLLTSTFIHFGLIHFVVNMIALAQAGPIVERLFGSKRFLLLYLGAALYGEVASLWWHPGANGAGASGAIFGVFGGLLAFVLNPRNAVPAAVMKSIRARTIPIVLLNLGIGLLYRNIDNAAHLGGLLGGVAMGILLARPLRKE